MSVPLGHRYRVSTKQDIIPVQRITKRAVDKILASGKFECLYKLDGSDEFKDYEGCLTNLTRILHDGQTKVKIAGSRTPGYSSKHQTVVMTAPCVEATILLRTKP